MKGQYTYDFVIVKFCLDILLLTWFFASLYFFFLYISLFLKSCRFTLRNIKYFNSSDNIKFKRSLFFYSSYSSIIFTFIILKTSLMFRLNYTFYFNNILSILFINLKNFNHFLVNSFWFSFFFFFISWSFFFLLNFENFFFESIYDTSWLSSFFFFYDFYMYDFYNF